MLAARNIVGLALLTAGALASWYLARQNRGEEPVVAAFDAVTRGYYLKSARILGTGPDGHLLYEIQAESAEQQSDDRIWFTDVKINYSPQSEVPWAIIADTAAIH